jgi:hypothetical protein
MERGDLLACSVLVKVSRHATIPSRLENTSDKEEGEARVATEALDKASAVTFS